MVGSPGAHRETSLKHLLPNELAWRYQHLLLHHTPHPNSPPNSATLHHIKCPLLIKSTPEAFFKPSTPSLE
ncbi:Pre-mRNA-splicing factor isy1 [Fusarium oxysporum f. sp. albedinis]|nr:Pre-mRNA-splicing factor isy1 [Fusarium oxysporum f. sp. albedinis]